MEICRWTSSDRLVLKASPRKDYHTSYWKSKELSLFHTGWPFHYLLNLYFWFDCLLFQNHYRLIVFVLIHLFTKDLTKLYKQQLNSDTRMYWYLVSVDRFMDTENSYVAVTITMKNYLLTVLRVHLIVHVDSNIGKLSAKLMPKCLPLDKKPARVEASLLEKMQSCCKGWNLLTFLLLKKRKL